MVFFIKMVLGAQDIGQNSIGCLIRMFEYFRRYFGYIKKIIYEKKQISLSF